jgi:hypothetical protein
MPKIFLTYALTDGMNITAETAIAIKSTVMVIKTITNADTFLEGCPQLLHTLLLSTAILHFLQITNITYGIVKSRRRYAALGFSRGF